MNSGFAIKKVSYDEYLNGFIEIPILGDTDMICKGLLLRLENKNHQLI